ncbi:hypothetical protein OUZ56_000022 [Daphnia magna]|uniref:Uncharacterized protein n=1 Tax=Daphnia magna TaxID=35525 RepID=A0ABQ9ZYH2_9CRUS|nr:hypothetical protein OUZ56_000022 [Daphnia magna]
MKTVIALACLAIVVALAGAVEETQPSVEGVQPVAVVADQDVAEQRYGGYGGGHHGGYGGGHHGGYGGGHQGGYGGGHQGGYGGGHHGGYGGGHHGVVEVDAHHGGYGGGHHGGRRGSSC